MCACLFVCVEEKKSPNNPLEIKKKNVKSVILKVNSYTYSTLTSSSISFGYFLWPSIHSLLETLYGGAFLNPLRRSLSKPSKAASFKALCLSICSYSYTNSQSARSNLHLSGAAYGNDREKVCCPFTCTANKIKQTNSRVISRRATKIHAAVNSSCHHTLSQ